MTSQDASRIIATVPGQLAQDALERGRRVEQLRQRERAGTNLRESVAGGSDPTARAETTPLTTASAHADRARSAVTVAEASLEDSFVCVARSLETVRLPIRGSVA